MGSNGVRWPLEQEQEQSQWGAQIQLDYIQKRSLGKQEEGQDGLARLD